MPRVRSIPILCKECPNHDRPRKYEGSQCSLCGCEFEPGTMRRVLRNVFMVDGADAPGYLRVPGVFYVCGKRRNGKACGNVFWGQTCPIDGAVRPDRHTTVWVRSGARTVSFDQLKDFEIAQVLDEFEQDQEGSSLPGEELLLDREDEGEETEEEEAGAAGDSTGGDP